MLCMFKSGHNLFAKVYVLKYFPNRKTKQLSFFLNKKIEDSCKYI